MKVMRKLISCTLAIIMLISVGIATGCGDSNMTISETSATMQLFEEKQLSVTSDVEGEIAWENSNDEVVNLTANGKSAQIIAIKSGTATITAKAGGKTATCSITVAPTEDTLVLNLTSSESVTLRAEETSQIDASVTFKDNIFNDAQVTYEAVNISPAGCVTVSETGLISAIAEGIAQIKVKAEYFGNISNEVTVSVIALRKAKPAESIEVSADKAMVDLLQDVNLSSIITPSDSTDTVIYNITKNGENTADAAVTEGVFRATVPGIYVVTASAGNKSDSVTITVPELNLNKSDIKLFINGNENYPSEVTVSATFTVGETTTDATLTAQESLNSEIAARWQPQ